MEVLEETNTLVNKKPYARELIDHWKTPLEFVKSKTADCEDYAITKYMILRKLGYKPMLMYCFIKREAHMVCIVSGFVLDNTTDEIKSLDQRKDLIEVYRFSHDCLVVGDHIEYGNPNIKLWNEMLDRMKGEQEKEELNGH